MPAPRLSVILLTWNEEANIRACLHALANQTLKDFEVILVDAASKDRTLDIVREMKPRFPVPILIEEAPRRIPIGEARNLGVFLSHAPFVAFLSADAEAGETWVQEALASLQRYDMVFGLQLHAPRRWTLGSSVRGLRYHYPLERAVDPLAYASNVAAAYRREILVRFPFDGWANAAEDLLLARRAHAAGFRAIYNPDMVVRHHDVDTARDEMRKSIREGEGWGLYRDELGLFVPVLGWGVALTLVVLLAVFLPHPVSFAAFGTILWLPAIRRAWRRRNVMPPHRIALALFVSPAFDFVFLLHYLRGLATSNHRKHPVPQGVPRP
ncbi:MAG TPA: glycosyltransferase [Candidatus Thermoplasmatota archaeon]|nr:glycosyltransferase [Candidatus Thermoplasmatota archaeon]